MELLAKRWLAVISVSLLVAGCDKASDSTVDAPPSAKGDVVDQSPAAEKAAAEQLRPAHDPVAEEAGEFIKNVRDQFAQRDFEALEKTAEQLRTEKVRFRNGSWKLYRFYDAMHGDLEWNDVEKIHQAWREAKPDSITAPISQAASLIEFAWDARGRGYANTVTDKGWQLFSERIQEAKKMLGDARPHAERDPYFWLAGLQVARAEGWPKEQYDKLVADAKMCEPKFWGYDTERAFSLLPRWYGEPGDWEAYAENEAQRPDGLGAEIYARIFIYLRGFHDNLFAESRASWPRVKEGLALMRERYPDTLEMVSHTAMIATMADDRELAQEMFGKLGDTYFPNVWRRPERFIHYRNWAKTGHW